MATLEANRSLTHCFDIWSVAVFGASTWTGLEKGFPFFLPRLCVIFEGRQTRTLESVILVFRATSWHPVDDVVERLQHEGIRIDADNSFRGCCGLLVPHNFAHHESTSTRMDHMHRGCIYSNSAPVRHMEPRSTQRITRPVAVDHRFNLLATRISSIHSTPNLDCNLGDRGVDAGA